MWVDHCGEGDSAVGEEAVEPLASGFIYDLGWSQGHQGKAEEAVGQRFGSVSRVAGPGCWGAPSGQADQAWGVGAGCGGAGVHSVSVVSQALCPRGQDRELASGLAHTACRIF